MSLKMCDWFCHDPVLVALPHGEAWPFLFEFVGLRLFLSATALLQNANSLFLLKLQ